MTTTKPFLLIFVLLLSISFDKEAYGQAGVSSMSVGMTRAGIFPAPGEIRVAEFINYHRHLLPEPEVGQRLSLDVKQRSFAGRRYVQIGMATPRALDLETAPPLNLVIVIDTSGSMHAGNRIERVRQGLTLLVERMRKDDQVALVAFNSTAEVLLHACRKTDQARIQKAIDSLKPGGSTNLHGGLMLGYQTASENFDSKRSNRVILLTDGIANVGKTDPKVLAEESATFNRRGIDLSTIGVGRDFNHGLLRELATAGRGAVHFVDDHEDLSKCFIDEVDSLLAPAARNLELVVSGFRPKSSPTIFGYQPTIKKQKLTLPLENMSCGATQVVILEFTEEAVESELQIRLQYSDAVNGCQTTLSESLIWKGNSADEYEAVSKRNTPDESDCLQAVDDFSKNLAIAFVSRSLAEAAELAQREDAKAARKVIKRALKNLEKLDVDRQDPEISRVAKIARELVER
ncbi:MAG: VWA domain-containing protein [Pirellulaceae bacterium]|nr:VWA domain-containing protein [Pirellulaceae bacterium]